jgi:TRAP-type C4-dicarboxylate transport system substrate-binding protein
MRPAFLLLLALTLISSVARAEPPTLRLATIAPEGSGWAREFSAWARDIEAGTHGAVRIKMYFSAIAGDDLSVLDRIKRDQLDGAIGSESCTRLGPSLRVTRIFGLFQNREESFYVLGRLAPILDAEFLKHGFINLGEATLGPEVLFTRQPVRDMAELRKTILWIWNLDDALALQTSALGLRTVALSLDGGSRAYDDKSVDGFVAMPTAALAFQWSVQARYLQNLELAWRNGCVFIASRAFDPLPIEVQRYMRAATAKLRQRLDDMNMRQDDALIGGLFARQGMKTIPVSEQFRLDFFREAREQRAKLGDKLVPPKLLEQVLAWLADYRAEHAIAK